MSNDSTNPNPQRIPFPPLRDVTPEQAQSILFDFFHTLIGAGTLSVPAGKDIYAEYIRHFELETRDLADLVKTLHLVANGTRAADESDLALLDNANRIFIRYLDSDGCAEATAIALKTAILKEFSPKVDTARTGAAQSV